MGKDSLIVEVYIDVIETVDGETEDVIEKETVDTNGFQVSASQVSCKNLLFVQTTLHTFVGLLHNLQI